MSTRVKSNLFLILTVIIALAITVMPYFISIINSYVTHAPVAESGFSDFSETDISKKTPIYLKGDWIKYSDTWIITDESDDIAVQGETQTLPVRLLGSFESINSSVGDKSSYVLNLKNLGIQNAVIYIPYFAGAYKIFLNGNLVSQSGVYSGTETQADLSINAIVLDFNKDESYQITIETSCHYMPGLYMTPAIANSEYVSMQSRFSVTMRSIIFGAIAFCTILFFVYSITKRKIFHSKWLPVLFLVIMFRLAISTDGYTSFSFLISRTDYEQLMLLICSSTFIIKLVSLLFYTETLDIKLNKTLSAVFCALFFIFTAVYCAFPKTVYTPFYNVLVQLATLPLDIILLGYLTDSIARKVPYATFYTIGYVTILSGLLIDCFYTNGLIACNAALALPLLCAFFVVSFSAIFIRKITEIYNSAIKAAELDKQLTDATTAVMVSQIQPHFLYNALNTIKYLIKRDPAEAEKAIVSFSYYLRGNMESLSQKAPIPFSDEIEHVKHYSDIELLRFGDRLKVEYDIKCDNFTVPSLTVQPIVENAIKHGVTKNPEGGTVKISSFEEDNFYCVTVDDDGIGFDVESPDYSDDEYHAHIGLTNVAKRLKHISNATFEIKSTEGEGTHVLMKFPKSEGKI